MLRRRLDALLFKPRHDEPVDFIARPAIAGSGHRNALRQRRESPVLFVARALPYPFLQHGNPRPRSCFGGLRAAASPSWRLSSASGARLPMRQDCREPPPGRASPSISPWPRRKYRAAGPPRACRRPARGSNSICPIGIGWTSRANEMVSAGRSGHSDKRKPREMMTGGAHGSALYGGNRPQVSTGLDPANRRHHGIRVGLV